MATILIVDADMRAAARTALHRALRVLSAGANVIAACILVLAIAPLIENILAPVVQSVAVKNIKRTSDSACWDLGLVPTHRSARQLTGNIKLVSLNIYVSWRNGSEIHYSRLIDAASFNEPVTIKNVCLDLDWMQAAPTEAVTVQTVVTYATRLPWLLPVRLPELVIPAHETL